MKRLSHTLRTRLIGAGLGSVLSALLLLAGLIGFTTPAAAEELLVKLVAGLTADQQADVIARNGGNEVSQITALRLHVIEVPPAELDAAIASYEADAEVERVELNATRKADSEPVGGWDPLYMDQWYLPQIDWDLPTLMPSGNAVVALLDTGVDATHPDLAGKVLPGTSILKETLKNGPISLSSPSESVFSDQPARFNRFLGLLWSLWVAPVVLFPLFGRSDPSGGQQGLFGDD